MAAPRLSGGDVRDSVRLLLSGRDVCSRGRAHGGAKICRVPRHLEPALWHPFPGAVVYLLHPFGPPSPQAIWHRAGRRVPAAGEHFALVDRRVSVAVCLGAAAGCRSLRLADAARLDLSAAAPMDPPATVVAGHGPNVSAAVAHERCAANGSPARAGLLSVLSLLCLVSALRAALLADAAFHARVPDGRRPGIHELPADAGEPS